MPQIATVFRERYQSHQFLLGTVIKLSTPHVVEIVAECGLDFVMIDAEHAALDRQTVDIAVLAARAAGIASLVRVPEESSILSALDAGASGVIVPHVSTPAKALTAARACRYLLGSRGFATSTRAGHFGSIKMPDHIGIADKAVSFVAMIEDAEALQHIDEIVATPGLDSIFLGRIDLTVSLGETSVDAPAVRSAVEMIVAATHRVSKPICAVVSSETELSWLRDIGVTAFIIGADVVFIKEGAERALRSFRTLTGQTKSPSRES